jgi:hypothetical protein
MSRRTRKALATAGLAAATLAAAFAATTAAAAAGAKTSYVTITANWKVVDDDSTVFGSSYDYA